MNITKTFIFSSIFFMHVNINAQSLNDALNSVSNTSNTSKNSSSAAEILTGDPRLACEAILCLSSATRPGECSPSINRYFSIHRKKFRDTLNARRNFLKLCPASKENNMPSLVNAIVNGAGRCDAAELNRVMRYVVQEKVCTDNRNKFGHGRDSITCSIVTKVYIKPSKPSYCNSYFNHEWTTVGDKVQYIGDEKNGGHWIDK